MPVQQDEKLKKFLRGQWSQLDQEWQTFRPWFQDVADYVAPQWEDLLNTELKGTQRGKKIYDGTAVSAAVLATDGIHGYHVSPAFPWFKFVVNRPKLNEIPAVQEWLQGESELVYQALARSNFYSEMWPYIYNGFTFGTAAISAEEDISTDRISFELSHIGDIRIGENKFREIDTFCKRMKKSARVLVQMFGEDNCTDAVKQAYKNQPFQEFVLTHCVYPREDFDSVKKDSKNKRFASVWYLEDQTHICRISGYDDFPYHVWRYMRGGRATFGYSPAMLSMPEIVGLNVLDKTILGVTQQAMNPAVSMPDYLAEMLDLSPGGRNVLTNPNDRVEPIVPTAGTFPIGIDRQQRKQAAIEQAFHVDTFLLLANTAGDVRNRTAFEVSRIEAEKAAILGAELGPLNNQLDAIIDRVYAILKQSGKTTEPPEQLLEAAANDPGIRFDPDYQGPLAIAQKEKFSSDPIQKFVLALQQIAPLNPEALDNVDFDQMVQTTATISGTPRKIIRPKEEVDALRQARMQAMMQQNQLDQLEQGAGALKTATEADQTSGGALSAALSEAAA